MGLPQAVKAQAEKAAAIQKELSNDKSEAQTPEKGEQPNAQPAPEPVKNVERAQKPDSVESLKAEMQKLDERYRSYKKMYDKEVHGFRTSIQEKDTEIETLKGQIKGLEAKIASAGQNRGSDDDNDDETLEYIKKAFGDEFVDAVSDLSRSELMRENAKLIARLDDIENRLKGIGNEQPAKKPAGEPAPSGNEFLANLSELVPNWRQINDSRAFKIFLDGIEPTDGRRLQEHLVDAQRKGDVIGVAEIFNRFVDSNPAPKGNQGGHMPDTEKGDRIDTDQGDDVIYDYELDQYYRDKKLGKFSPSEVKKIEAKIDRAMAKGKIVRTK